MQGQLNLKHLSHFYEVARHGSIAEASRANHASPSTISEQVRLLEDRLGRPLFFRSSNGLRLTEEGKVLYQQAELIFESVDRVLNHFHHREESNVAILRVGNAASLSRSQTAADLVALFRVPDTRVRVQTGSCDKLIRGLLDGELDLVLSDREPPKEWKGSLRSERLQGSPLVVVVGPTLGKELHHGIRGLQNIPMLQYTVSSRYRWDLERWLREHDLSPRVLGEVDDVSLLLSTARADLCFAVVPQAALVDAGPGLHVVATLDEHIATERHAICRDGQALEMVETAITELRSHARRSAAPSALTELMAEGRVP